MAEVNYNGSGSTITNYGVSSREGKIYRSSKTPEEGFEKIELQSGGVTYHKYVDGLSGKITYMARDQKEIQHEGKTKKLDNFKFFLNDGQNTQAISVSTYSQEYKLLVKHLFNADFTKNIEIGFYKKKSENDKFYLNCFVKYADEKTEDGKPIYPEWLDVKTKSKGGEVPDPEKNKKGEWDWTDNDIWYLEKQQDLVNRFMEAKNSGQSSPQTSKPDPKAVKPVSPAEAFEPAGSENTDYQQLPF